MPPLVPPMLLQCTSNGWQPFLVLVPLMARVHAGDSLFTLQPSTEAIMQPQRSIRRSQFFCPVMLCFAGSLAGGACVTTGTHEAKIAELDEARKDAAERDRQHRERIAALEEELAKLLQSVEQVTGERDQLTQGLNEARGQLEELRRQKAAAEARAATFRGLVAKLRSMIDAGTIKVTIRNGRMLITLPNDVLFDSGKKKIKPEGQTALATVAQALSGIADRRFLVAGHTDNVPINTPRFRSNWELSTARAVEVTKLLIISGMRPQVVAAAGYGEFDPVASNDSPEGKSQNRRIEIIICNVNDAHS